MRERKRVRTINDMASETVQSDVHQSEITEVLAKYPQLGIRQHLRDVDLQFRDVSEFADYQSMARTVVQARESFMRLPSKLREAFGHDVYLWLDAAQNPELLEQLRPKLERLGVLEPLPADLPPEPAPPSDPAVSD